MNTELQAMIDAGRKLIAEQATAEQRKAADAARARLHVLERRYATLQTMHADKTRQLLARNYPIIEAHVIARRSAKN